MRTEPSVSSPLLSRSALALYGLALLVAAPYALPASLAIPYAPALSVGRLRLLTPKEQASAVAVVAAPTAVGVAALVVETDDTGKRASATAAEVAVVLPPTPKVSLDDPSGHALDGFYAALARTAAHTPGAITRIAYFGDSVVAADWITSTLRRSLQTRFGDAGHGYVLPANAWPGYFHQDVARFASPGWKASRVVGPFDPDGVYGLGGVTLVAEGPGTFATVATVPTVATGSGGSTIGGAVSRFRVTYREAPGGGDLRLSVDGKTIDTLATRADSVRVATRLLPVADGPHKLEVRSMGNGPVGVLGVDLEREGPGVIVDALGIVGCRLRFLDKTRDDVLATSLQDRSPALVVLAYGANESEDGFAYSMVDYERTAREVIQKVRRAAPGSSCLLVGPMDRADKHGDTYSTRPVIPELNRIQKQLAGELGCAFFDTFRAMGGFGSMGVWIQRGLGGKDLVHPTNEGAAVLAGWIEAALLARFATERPAPSPASSH